MVHVAVAGKPDKAVLSTPCLTGPAMPSTFHCYDVGVIFVGEVIIALIQTNMVMLQGSYRALLYTSLAPGERPERHSVRMRDF